MSLEIPMVRRYDGTLVDVRNVTIENYRECKRWKCPICDENVHFTQAHMRRNGSHVRSHFKHTVSSENSAEFNVVHNGETMQHLNTKLFILRNLPKITFIATLCDRKSACKDQSIRFKNGETCMVEVSSKELQKLGLIPPSISIPKPFRPDITVIDKSRIKVCCFIEVEYSHRRKDWDIIRPLEIPCLEIFAEESFQMKSNVFYDVQPCKLCKEHDKERQYMQAARDKKRDLQAQRDKELQFIQVARDKERDLQAERDKELQFIQVARDKERKRQKINIMKKSKRRKTQEKEILQPDLTVAQTMARESARRVGIRLEPRSAKLNLFFKTSNVEDKIQAIE